VIRLVASDVDGTLLDHHGHLPAARAAAVRRLSAAGVPLVLATGKLWTSVRALVEELGLAGPHVACNGSVVFSGDGTVLGRTLLDSAVADEVIAVLHARGIVHAVYLADGTLVTDRIDAPHDVLPVLGEPMPVIGPHAGRGVIKILAFLPPEAEADLRGLAADAARIQRTGPRFLEWNAPTADKATGLAAVALQLGVALADVLAVGDAENDVPMLRVAGIGVAVHDASPAARSVADLVLTTDLAELFDDIASGRPVGGSTATSAVRA